MRKNKIKTIYIGTPEFAVPSLEKLFADNDFEIQIVITKPDAKIGRKQILTPTPVKLLAEKYQAPLKQPEKITEIIPDLTALKPDFIIVAAYSQIIPEAILTIPKYGCINIHGSLLPKYRGSSCVQAAILNGDKEAGVTIMKMDKTLDTGPIYSQKSLKIDPKDTFGSLYEKLSKISAPLLADTLKRIVCGQIKPQPQDDSQASTVRIIKKDDGLINTERTAMEIERFIRAMRPWPGAFMKFDDMNIKILETAPEPIPTKGAKSGQLFIYDDKLALQAADDALEVIQIQPAGKKAMNAKSFINGYKKYIYNA